MVGGGRAGEEVRRGILLRYWDRQAINIYIPLYLIAEIYIEIEKESKEEHENKK